MKLSLVIVSLGVLSQSCTRAPEEAPPEPVKRVLAPDPGSLRALYQAPLPELIAKLKDPAMPVRATAAVALGRSGAEAEIAVPMLVDALGDREEEVVRCAADALGQIGPKARGATDALLRTLESPSPSLRRSAAHALARVGAGPEVLPALARAFDREDFDGGAPVAALDAIVSIGPSRAETLAMLLLALDDKRMRVRDAALGGLGRLETLPDSAVVELGWHLETADPIFRRRIPQFLGKLRSGAALPALYGILRDEGDDLNRSAAAAIVAIRKP